MMRHHWQSLTFSRLQMAAGLEEGDGNRRLFGNRKPSRARTSRTTYVVFIGILPDTQNNNRYTHQLVVLSKTYLTESLKFPVARACVLTYNSWRATFLRFFWGSLNPKTNLSLFAAGRWEGPGKPLTKSTHAYSAKRKLTWSCPLA